MMWNELWDGLLRWAHHTQATMDGWQRRLFLGAIGTALGLLFLAGPIGILEWFGILNITNGTLSVLAAVLFGSLVMLAILNAPLVFQSTASVPAIPPDDIDAPPSIKPLLLSIAEEMKAAFYSRFAGGQADIQAFIARQPLITPPLREVFSLFLSEYEKGSGPFSLPLSQANPTLLKRMKAILEREGLYTYPLSKLENLAVKTAIDDKTRFEHTWLIANSGHGKTQTIQHLITHDLQRVAKGEISLIVIEPKDKLIEEISSLKMFAPGEALDGRLVLIDPGLYPPAINLVDKNFSAEMFQFVFGSLLDTAMTANQEALFTNILLLLKHVPDANLMTLMKVLGGEELYQEHWHQLPPLAKRFFEKDYDTAGVDGYKATRQQVVRRLNVLATKYPFSEMFEQSTTELNLAEKMNGGHVVLVNASIDKLGEQGARLFGRFFLALAANATSSRTGSVRPCFLYLDECDVFAKDDLTIQSFLARARQNSVGLFMAHRWLKEIGTSKDAFENTCSIILAGGLRAEDLAFMSKVMSAPQSLIDDKNPKGRFGVYVRGKPLFSADVPFGTMTALPHMKRQELEDLRAKMAEDYGIKKRPPSEMPIALTD